MTTEEKAKRYDEALNWMRELYPGLHGATKEDAEHFFPELRESEDERIRKLLVWQVYRNIEDDTNDLAQSVYDGIKGHDPDIEESIEDWKKCLAYLEKQKERGPLTKEEEYTLHRIIEYLEDETCPSEWISLLHDIYCLPYEKQKEEEGYDAIPVESTLEYKLGFKAGKDSEKQKEQEPVQTDDEKEYIRTLKSLISDFIRDKQPEDVAFYQKIYDWLDGRHVEQKPNIELIQRSWYMEGYHDREFGKEPKWIIKTGEGGPKHELNPKYGQMLEAEQKPAEGTALQKAFISSKIDYTLEEKCDASDYAEAILPTSVVYGENEEEYKLHKIIEAAFIAGQKKEQKSTEWSEEDREITQNILDFLKDPITAKWCPQLRKECQNWLKSLRPQPKQEWSEEDEDRYNSTIEVLQIAEANNGYNHYGRQEIIKDIAWLKSLRPSWKPSEEQMEALEYVCRVYSSGGAEKSLYNNLKKLCEQLQELV